MKVGRELRRRRNELGLSLREVAELTELSTGFLSQLENDQVSPSLASLDRIAQALRIPMYELLSSDNRDPVVRAGARPRQNLGSPELQVELLTNFQHWQMLPFHRCLAVGEKYEAVRIERAREEWMYVLAGIMEIYLRDQQPHVLHPGDSIHFASSRLEAVNSIGDEPLELICMMTPPAY
ncbi:MAG: helix-turn-helix domain-containing protein [Acidimicrobiia bacterium]|nr:helix-turn-helix domain-containing protein [Acidimicrobiia bacterium]